MDSRNLGKTGEAFALSELKGRGFEILETNFFCPFGELDIVARDLASLVFVEVKCRSRIEGMEQAVGPLKIKRLKLSARFYLQATRLVNEDFRFMLIYVLFPSGADRPEAVHIIEDPF